MIALLLLFQLMTPSRSCDSSLQEHVYKPQRLVTLKGCISVKGVIIWRRFERDGDLHLRLRLDRRHRMGESILLEIICAGPIRQTNAVESCRGFKNTVMLPKLGQTVQAVGMHVLDRKHGGIPEIHPVTSISLLKGGL